MERFRVLVVDDEFWIRENLRTILDWNAHSYEFLPPAEDGEQALSVIRKEQPDIVITDVNMPFLSGTQLIAQAKKEFPWMVFIALSGYSDYDFVRTALVEGAMDYLLKPITKSDLLAALSKAVSQILSDRASTQEKADMQEMLRMVSSAALDNELSRFVHRTRDQREQEEIQGRLSEYELDFSGFTLVLFRLMRTGKKRKPAQNMDQWSYRIKEMIADAVGSAKKIVFHNTYKTNEFLLITDLGKKDLIGICRALIRPLEEVASSVLAVISEYYYSFSSLKTAYNEVILAMLSSRYGLLGEVIPASEMEHTAVKKHISPEQEKQLLFAVSSGNRQLFESVLYGEIGLQNCLRDEWLYVEVRQTVDHLARILCNLAENQALLLVLDNFTDLMLLAVDNVDLDEVLSILSQMLDECFHEPGQGKHSESMRRIVEQVKEYITENYFEDLSLNMLAKRFAVDDSYLSKAFKQSVGDNLMLYIAKQRVNKAKSYVADGKLSITEISQLVGYGDYAYFSRVFRKLEGVSPREYREGGKKG